MIRLNQTRRGLTLIELLVVLGILTLLAALVMSGVAAVRDRQMVNSSANTVGKLQDAIDTQVKALVDQAAKDRRDRTGVFQNQTFMTFCGNDDDRAQALLAYLKLRHAFPQTYTEATTNVQLLAAGINWPPHKAYANLPAISAWTSPTGPDEQSAALLYIGLSSMGAGGSAFASDDATSGNQTDWVSNGITARVFTDAWKRPIGFKRFFEHAELNNAPYANQKDFANGRSIDPFDPLGKLATPTSSWLATTQTQAQNTVGASFNKGNKVITAYSWSSDKTPNNLDPAMDDIVGYRLRQLGSNATGKKQ